MPKKRLAAQLGLDRKTVRRYVSEAENCGVRLEDGLAGLTDELVGARRPARGREWREDGGRRCWRGSARRWRA